MTSYGENLSLRILIVVERLFSFQWGQKFRSNCSSNISVPKSSAAVERNFSNKATIHTKRRNNLSNKNVVKLWAIQFNCCKKGISEYHNYDQNDKEIIYHLEIIEEEQF